MYLDIYEKGLRFSVNDECNDWKTTSEKRLNNSEIGTCTFYGYHGCRCKVGRTNIAALAIGHNHFNSIPCTITCLI